jgi:hypothetical protein
MITEIGISAGEIWQVLDKQATTELKDLLKAIDAPRDLILMGLGWLAREGHVNLVAVKENEYKISLNRDYQQAK